MIPASSKDTQTGDWARQWREAIVDPCELLGVLGLAHLSAQLPAAPPHGFSMRVPRAFVARMRRGDVDDPLLRQVLPQIVEIPGVNGFSLDPVGDMDALALAGEGVLQKYAGRALLVATGSCAVHCRYCFRRHFPYSANTAARDEWSAAIRWLQEHPDTLEVILSGGDPLSLATSRLASFTGALRGVPHVQTLRIHTRLPVVLPARVDAELCDWLAHLPLSRVVVIHANHANEFDADVDAALRRLRDAGCVLLNQSVLLRGINDSVDALADLSRRLLAAGVVPYYLHALDAVAGAAHFSVPDDEALQLVGSLRDQLPGYLVPRLVREIAGRASKTPIEVLNPEQQATEVCQDAPRAGIRR